MSKFARFAFALAAVAVVALPVAADGPCLGSTVLAQGAFSPYDPSPHCDAGTCPGLDVVIDNSVDFTKWWRQISTDPAPSIDFRSQTVLATFMGKRPNTSYTTSIDCVHTEGLVNIGNVPLTAEVTDSNLGAGCIVQPAVVSPFEFIAFDRPTNGLGQPLRATVTFEHTPDVTTCDPDDPICQICLPGGGDGDIEPGGIPCCP